MKLTENKFIQRSISLLLALVTVFSIGSPALAAHDTGSETGHGTEDAAYVSSEGGAPEDGEDGSKLYITDVYLTVNQPDEGPTRPIIVVRGDKEYSYDIDTAYARNLNVNVTVPLFMCMYAYGGDGHVVVPEPEAYKLKNNSTEQPATTVTAIRRWQRVYDTLEDLLGTDWEDEGVTLQYRFTDGGAAKELRQTKAEIRTSMGLLNGNDKYAFYVDETEMKVKYITRELCDNRSDGAGHTYLYMDRGDIGDEEITLDGQTYKKGNAIETSGESSGADVRVSGVEVTQLGGWTLAPTNARTLLAHQMKMTLGGVDLATAVGGTSFITGPIWWIPYQGELPLAVTAAIAGDSVNADSHDSAMLIKYTVTTYDPQETYTVSFNAGEGSGTMPVQYVPAGGSVTIQPCVFTAPENKVFKHWRAADGTTYAAGATLENVSGDVELTAIWETARYTVRLYPNYSVDGTPLDPTVFNNVEAGTSITASAPTRTGYAFLYWTENAAGTGTQHPAGSITVEKDLDLYAQWEETYAITYNANGGTGSMSPNPVNSRKSVALTAASCGFSAPANKYFTGWNTAADGSGTAYAVGATLPKANTTLYAQWAYYTYTVQYRPGDGANGEAQDKSYNNGTQAYALGVSELGFTKTDSDFDGWKDGSGSDVAVGDALTMNADTTLTAQWKTRTYTVTYKPDADAEETTWKKYTYDHSDTAQKARSASDLEFTKTNYDFDGWLGSDGEKYAAGDDLPLRTDLTLTAQWKSAGYTVTQYPNYGDDEPVSNEYDPGATVRFTALVRSGYTFTGWNTSRDGSGTAYDVLTEYTIDASLTLYAQWLKNYTITFSANTGTGTMEPIDDIAPNEKVTLPENAFTKANNLFKYWNTAANDSGTRYDPGDEITVTGDMTLYAIWGATRTITYNKNGGTGDNYTSQVANGMSVAALENRFTRDYYHFTGWNTAANGTGRPYAVGDTISNVTGNITLYAQWSGNEYPVIFHSNYGDDATETKNVVYNTNVLADAPAFTRTGYTLNANWKNGTASGVGTTSVAATTKLTAATFPTLATDGVAHVYAQWTARTYTVVYNTNGKGGTLQNTTKTFGTNTGLRTPGAYTGRTFLGWAFDAAAETPDIPRASMSSVSDADLGNSDYHTTTITLYAVWEATKYNVTYKCGFTPAETDVVVQAAYNSTFTADPDTFTRFGYTLSGWKVSNPNTTIAVDGSFTMPAANVNLTAQWTPKPYTVVYHANYGDLAAEETTELTVNYAASVSMAANRFTRAGYTLSAWGEARDTGDTYTASGNKALNTTNFPSLTATEDVLHLYARWTPRTYTVAYNLSGGSIDPAISNQTKTFTQDITVSDAEPTKANYTFLGWALVNNATEATITKGQKVSDSDLGNATYARTTVTLYAVWQGYPYDVKFDLNSDEVEGTAPDTMTKYWARGLTLPTNTYTRAHYDFLGWSTSRTATSTSLTPGKTGVTDGNLGRSSYSSDPVTLYAVWALQKHDIIYDANGGTGTMANQSVQYGKTATLTENAFTRTDYGFTGWNTEADGSGTAYADKARNVPTGGMGDEDIKLYAQWKATYTITYDPNAAYGGYGSMSPVTKFTDETVTAAACAFRNDTEGLRFAGWNTAADGTGTAYAVGDTLPTVNTTLYAQWDYVYTVHYVLGGTYGWYYMYYEGDSDPYRSNIPSFPTTELPAADTKIFGVDLTLPAYSFTTDDAAFDIVGWTLDDANANATPYIILSGSVRDAQLDPEAASPEDVYLYPVVKMRCLYKVNYTLNYNNYVFDNGEYGYYFDANPAFPADRLPESDTKLYGGDNLTLPTMGTVTTDDAIFIHKGWVLWHGGAMYSSLLTGSVTDAQLEKYSNDTYPVDLYPVFERQTKYNVNYTLYGGNYFVKGEDGSYYSVSSPAFPANRLPKSDTKVYGGANLTLPTMGTVTTDDAKFIFRGWGVDNGSGGINLLTGSVSDAQLGKEWNDTYPVDLWPVFEFYVKATVEYTAGYAGMYYWCADGSTYMPIDGVQPIPLDKLPDSQTTIWNERLTLRTVETFDTYTMGYSWADSAEFTVIGWTQAEPNGPWSSDYTVLSGTVSDEVFEYDRDAEYQTIYLYPVVRRNARRTVVFDSKVAAGEHGDITSVRIEYPYSAAIPDFEWYEVYDIGVDSYIEHDGEVVGYWERMERWKYYSDGWTEKWPNDESMETVTDLWPDGNVYMGDTTLHPIIKSVMTSSYIERHIY